MAGSPDNPCNSIEHGSGADGPVGPVAAVGGVEVEGHAPNAPGTSSGNAAPFTQGSPAPFAPGYGEVPGGTFTYGPQKGDGRGRQQGRALGAARGTSRTPFVTAQTPRDRGEYKKKRKQAEEMGRQASDPSEGTEGNGWRDDF